MKPGLCAQPEDEVAAIIEAPARMMLWYSTSTGAISLHSQQFGFLVTRGAGTKDDCAIIECGALPHFRIVVGNGDFSCMKPIFCHSIQPDAKAGSHSRSIPGNELLCPAVAHQGDTTHGVGRQSPILHVFYARNVHEQRLIGELSFCAGDISQRSQGSFVSNSYSAVAQLPPENALCAYNSEKQCASEVAHIASFGARKINKQSLCVGKEAARPVRVGCSEVRIGLMRRIEPACNVFLQ